MEPLTIVLLIAVVLLGGVVAISVAKRNQTKLSLKDGKGRELALSSADEQDRRAVIKDSESKEGGALAEDLHGQGALIEKTTVSKDLVARSSLPKKN